MNIDFPPPSNGTYNNAGSSRKLCNYCEHEDMERMEQGIYTEGFFNLRDDNVYKSQVIKDIDSNKGLSAEDIKFYGKIHFSRDRSDTELNMHCHLIVSRKNQSNKVKISPLTNHRNTKKGVTTGGFDRTALFEKVEKGFDKLFGYNRQLSETFEYCNTMKNGSIVDKLRMQEREQNTPEQNFAGEKKKKKEDLQMGRYADKQADMIESKFANKQDSNSTDLGLSSVFGVLTPNTNNREEEQVPVKKKKLRPRLS